MSGRQSGSRSPARSQLSGYDGNSTQGSIKFGSGEAKDLYISQLMREIKDLKQSEVDYKNIASTVANLERRYSQMKTEKAQAEFANSKKHDELVDRLAGLRTKIDEYKLRLAEKESECKNINEDIEGVQRSHTLKKQSVDQLTFELDELINKKSQFENELSSLKNLHSRVIGEREDLFTSINLGNRKLEELYKNASTLESENNDLEARIEAKRRAVDALNGHISEGEREIDQIRAEIEDKEHDCGEIEKSIITLSSKLDNEKRARDSEKEDLDNSNLDFSKLLNTINELNLTLQKTQAKLRGKEKKLEEKRSEISTIESKTETLRGKNEEVQEHIETLRNSIEKTISLCKDVGS